MLALIIVIIAIVVIAGVAAAVMFVRRRRLQQRFGPEYDRVADEHDSRMKADAELSRRERRVSELNIQPLEPAAQARYAAEWATIQEQFVDAPQGAVGQAQDLVVAVMNERGYPTEHRDQVLADLSVEHAAFLDHYRAASDVSESAIGGTASTEDLRQAMIHYRALFQELLGQPADTATAVADRGSPPTEPGLAPAANGGVSSNWPASAEAAPATDASAPVSGAGPVAETRPDPADSELASGDAASSDTASSDAASSDAASNDTALPADGALARGDAAPASTTQPAPVDTAPGAAAATDDAGRRAAR